MTRRTFLKLLGICTVIAFLGKFSSLMEQSNLSLIPKASGQSLGSWSLGPNLSHPAIHLALLNTGRILYVSGSGYHAATFLGPYTATVFDPVTNSEVKQFTFTEDTFCCGFNQLENGNILVTGGTKDYDFLTEEGKFHGLSSAYEFDVATENFSKVSSMAHGRWYPTQVTLPNSKVAIFNGFDEFGDSNKLVEIYDPISKNFNIKYDSGSSLWYCVGFSSSLPGAGTPCYGGIPGRGVSPSNWSYPRIILMPSGILFQAGQERTFYTWNPTDGRWRNAGMMNFFDARTYGCTVLLPLDNTMTERGRILIAGGIEPDSMSPATSTAELLDFNAGTSMNPTINYTDSMTNGRTFANPVILPTGKIVLFGGTSDLNGNPVFAPDMFDPVTNTWSVLPAATVPRWYHSNAILLPDGRVCVVSGTPTFTFWEPRVEYFSPSYLFAGTRPIISGTPTVGPYGGKISIPTPDASSITSVSLVRLGTPTHHFDNDMRCLWLQIRSSTSSSITVSAPISANLAPPGYYMLHILNSTGIPSIAKIIKIPGGFLRRNIFI